MPQKHSKNSWLLGAIQRMSNHAEDNSMYYRLKPPKDGGCNWRTSEEDHWVAHFASCLLDRSRHYRPGIQFHQFIEKPSHQSESKKKGGYDLSAGPHDKDTLRVRSMHKVVKGKWCDAYWTWRTTAQADKDHMQALLSNPVGYPCYLVVNVFYCLHDWRRMGNTAEPKGDKFDGFLVPDFNSPLRTVIVDLLASKDYLPEGATLVVGCEGLKKPAESIEEWKQATSKDGFVFARVNDIPLKIVTVDELLDDVDRYWLNKNTWAASAVQNVWTAAIAEDV